MLTETELAAEVVRHLDEAGWETYQEVQLAGRRADIVAVRHGTELMVVETKLNLTFDLLDQAFRWKPYAHAVYIAVPFAKYTDGRAMAMRVARQYLGLGVMEVGESDSVSITREAPALTMESENLRNSLRPEHKTHAKAGSNHGGHFTSFAGTAEAFADYVASDPRCKVEDAVNNIKHHYRTDSVAVEQLTKAVKKGLIPRVRWMNWRGRVEPC